MSRNAVNSLLNNLKTPKLLLQRNDGLNHKLANNPVKRKVAVELLDYYEKNNNLTSMKQYYHQLNLNDVYTKKLMKFCKKMNDLSYLQYLYFRLQNPTANDKQMLIDSMLILNQFGLLAFYIKTKRIDLPFPDQVLAASLSSMNLKLAILIFKRYPISEFHYFLLFNNLSFAGMVVEATEMLKQRQLTIKDIPNKSLAAYLNTIEDEHEFSIALDKCKNENILPWLSTIDRWIGRLKAREERDKLDNRLLERMVQLRPKRYSKKLPVEVFN